MQMETSVNDRIIFHTKGDLAPGAKKKLRNILQIFGEVSVSYFPSAEASCEVSLPVLRILFFYIPLTKRISYFSPVTTP